MPLRTYLTRLLWLSLLPLLLLAAWLAWHHVASLRAELEREAGDWARNFATTVDQHLEARLRALDMLVRSPLLDEPARWRELYREAQAFQGAFGSHVILADVGQPMRMLFNTRAPYGSPLPLLPRPQGHAAAPAALATKRPAVGDSFIGPLFREPLVALAVPVLRQDKVAFILLTTFENREFQRQLDQLALPAGWSLSLLDGRGASIARRGPPPGSARDGRRFEVASQRSPWKVVLEIPRAVHQAPLDAMAAYLGLGILGATLVGVLGGSLAGRRLGRAVASLTADTEPGAAVSGIREIDAARRQLDSSAADSTQSEAALRASEQRFRRLFQEAPLPLCFVDKQGVLVDRNARFLRIFGFSREDVPTLAEWWLRAYPDPAYRAWVQETWNAAVARAAENGTDIEPVEYQVTCKDGARRSMLISGIPIEEDFLATFFDLSERREAEAQLQLWADSMENAHFGLALADAHSNVFLAVNPSFARERGYRPEELIGQPIMSVYPPDRIAAVKAHIDELDVSSHGVFETEHLRRDGSRFPVQMDITVLRDIQGKPAKRIGYALDISERKRAEQALREMQTAELERQRQARLAALNQMADANQARAEAEAAAASLRVSEERLRLFIEHAPAALAMFDRDMRYLAFSQRWLVDFSLGERDLMGLSHYAVFPEIGEELKAKHRRGLAGEVMRADEDRFERADGRVQRLRWEMRPWHSATGGVGGIVIFSEDITRFVEAREEIHRLNTGLEQRVAERTAELSAANRELDAFAYAVSHDLRAPLRAMSGFAQALEEDFSGQLHGEAKTYLDQISLASGRMSELIDGILALSRSTRGEMRRDPVDLGEMASQLLQQLARTEPGRQVTTEVADGLLARGDARMLEAALANLLGNAWKYTARAAEAHIRLYTEMRGNERWFCVADNGAGFDMAHAERLFKPFQRLHRQEEFPGIGIGLATVQRIIQRHGGRIEAQGEVGRGAVFCFNLGPEGGSQR